MHSKDKPYIFKATDGHLATQIKHVSESHKEALEYMIARADGTIRSIRTPWKKWNDQLTDGIELNTINVLGARSGGGKTLTATQITRNAMIMNPEIDIAILDLQFEMLGRNTSMRSLSQELKMSMKKLKSADGSVMSKSELDAAERIFARDLLSHIYDVNSPLDLDAIYEILKIFSRRIGKPFMVTLDHALLVKRSKHHKSQTEKLEALGEFMTETKKEFPMVWLVLSQLNRNIFNMDRLTPGSHGNYPLETDLFGADALLQHADNVILFDQPLKRNLVDYGPHRWTLDHKLHKDYIAIHQVKGREGSLNMWWMELEGHNMNLRELDHSEYPFSKGL
jgi:replicative DNA helicase